MQATEQLKKEHKAVELMLEILAAVSERIESGKTPDQKDLADIIEFIKVFTDKCHHGKEENILFPALEQAGIPKEGGPIGVMLTEHDMGRGYVKGMVQALNNKDMTAFAKNARDYISLLTQHIDKENNILYFMADMHLAAEQQDELFKEFEKLEQERIGQGKHEEFHALLEKLAKTYL